MTNIESLGLKRRIPKPKFPLSERIEGSFIVVQDPRFIIGDMSNFELGYGQRAIRRINKAYSDRPFTVRIDNMSSFRDVGGISFSGGVEMELKASPLNVSNEEVRIEGTRIITIPYNAMIGNLARLEELMDIISFDEFVGKPNTINDPSAFRVKKEKEDTSNERSNRNHQMQIQRQRLRDLFVHGLFSPTVFRLEEDILVKEDLFFGQYDLRRDLVMRTTVPGLGKPRTVQLEFVGGIKKKFQYTNLEIGGLDDSMRLRKKRGRYVGIRESLAGLLKRIPVLSGPVEPLVSSRNVVFTEDYFMAGKEFDGIPLMFENLGTMVAPQLRENMRVTSEVISYRAHNGAIPLVGYHTNKRKGFIRGGDNWYKGELGNVLTIVPLTA